MENSKITIKRKKDSRTSNGAPLKRLRHITCPYTGVQMISASLYDSIAASIDEMDSTERIVALLGRYAKNMQYVEDAVFTSFCKFRDISRNDSISDFLQINYDSCLGQLKLEELRTIDKVDTMSQQLGLSTQLALRSGTTDARRQILDGSVFKRKNFFAMLDTIVPDSSFESEVLDSIRDYARFLPQSLTSIYAFCVKYSTYDDKSIFKRLLFPSIATIEHIHPSSSGGTNSLSNFMLASEGANKLRENMNLDIFIDHYPAIVGWTEIYICEVMHCIEKGMLAGYENYPYEVAQTLKRESKGRISIRVGENVPRLSESPDRRQNVR